MKPKEEIYNELLEGKTYVLIAKEEGVSSTAIRRLFTEEEKEEIKTTKLQRSAAKEEERTEVRVVEKRLIPKAKPRILFKAVCVEKEKEPFRVEDAGVIDLWSYSPKKDKYNSFVSLDKDFGLRGIPTLNTPYFQFNSAKRLNQVARSIFKTDYLKARDAGRLGKKPGYYSENNFMELLNPDIPLISKEDLPRHDIDTLNASIGFSDNLNDFLQTQEDACIISVAFAERFTFRYISPRLAILTTSEDRLKTGMKVKAGDLIEKLEDENLTKLNQIKQDGAVYLKSQKQLIKEDKKEGIKALWLNRVTIETIRGLEVGDKLRSLSGMKVIISEIRKNQIEDIKIHRNQIESKTGLKGSFIMELLKTKRVMVGMRRDEFIGREESLLKGGSLSSTLYPVLKLYAPKVLKEVLKDNSRFYELLLSLHLKYDIDTGTFKLLPESLVKEGYKKGGHRLWKEEDMFEGFFGKLADFDIRDLTFRVNKGELTGGKWLVWENLYVPSFVNNGYFKDSKWNKPPYTKFIEKEDKKTHKTIKEGKTFDETYNEFMNGKLPFLWRERTSEAQKARGERNEPEYKDIIKKVLFPGIRNGLYLKAVLSPDPSTVTLSSKHKGFGKEVNGIEYVIVTREPCVGFDNVYCFPVRYEDGLNPFVVRIPIDAIKAAQGDTDGDDIAVLPYYDENLLLENHDILKQLPKQDYVTSIDYFKPFLKERSRDELISEALEERELAIQTELNTEKLGGAKKRASFRCQSEEEQRAVLEVRTIEDIRKQERGVATIQIQDAIKELNGMGRRDPPDNENLNFLTQKAASQGGGKKLGWERLLGFKPSGFWLDLFNLPINEAEAKEQRNMEKLKGGKKILL